MSLYFFSFFGSMFTVLCFIPQAFVYAWSRLDISFKKTVECSNSDCNAQGGRPSIFDERHRLKKGRGMLWGPLASSRSVWFHFSYPKSTDDCCTDSPGALTRPTGSVLFARKQFTAFQLQFCINQQFPIKIHIYYQILKLSCFLYL